MNDWTDLRFFDKERALKNTFPGIDCGNKKCLMICAETLSAAQTMRLDEKQAVEKAIQQHILPEFHCTPAMNHQLLHQNVCRFGFYPEDRTILSLSSKPPKLQLKQFVAGASACKRCKELNGKIVTNLEEKAQEKMQQKGFYKQNDDSYAPHPHCKCKWNRIPGKELSFACKNLGTIAYIIPGSQAFNGLADMINKIKSKKLSDNSVTYLRIIAHGKYEGNTFPLETKSGGDRFEDIRNNLNKKLLDELKRIMAPMGLIELRMCYGIKNKSGEKLAQDLANITGCIVRAYKSEINLWGLGTKKSPRLPFTKDTHFNIPVKIYEHYKDFYPNA